MKQIQKKSSLVAAGVFGLAMILVGCGGASGTTTGGGTGGATNGSTGGQQQQFNVVTLTVNTVEALDTFDVVLIDKADFKATLYVASGSKSFDAIKNQDTISPGWSYARNVTNVTSVPIRIVMKEEDSGLTGADDTVDLDPSSNQYEVNCIVNTITGQVTGDVSGNINSTFTMSGGGDTGKSETGRARITFRISGS